MPRRCDTECLNVAQVDDKHFVSFWRRVVANCKDDASMCLTLRINGLIQPNALHY